MKKIFLFLLITAFSLQIKAQSDRQLVTKACMNYLEGFYEGNTNKLKASLKPTLHKFGFWKSEKTNKYGKASYMTFEGALEFAKDVESRKKYAEKGSPKKVEILDLLDKIAAVKVTAYWGVDYVLLSKQSTGVWMIEQVIWQGPNK